MQRKMVCCFFFFTNTVGLTNNQKDVVDLNTVICAAKFGESGENTSITQLFNNYYKESYLTCDTMQDKNII